MVRSTVANYVYMHTMYTYSYNTMSVHIYIVPTTPVDVTLKAQNSMHLITSWKTISRDNRPSLTGYNVYINERILMNVKSPGTRLVFKGEQSKKYTVTISSVNAVGESDNSSKSAVVYFTSKQALTA